MLIFWLLQATTPLFCFIIFVHCVLCKEYYFNAKEMVLFKEFVTVQYFLSIDKDFV